MSSGCRKDLEASVQFLGPDADCPVLVSARETAVRPDDKTLLAGRNDRIGAILG
jgi:predicted nucleic acid binding AN1-type Zn finger protein